MKKINYIFLSIFFCILFGCSEDTIDIDGIGTLTGIVVEKGTNEPIENVKISTDPATSTVFTDENGEFILPEIPTGEYSVQATKEGLLTEFEGANVLPNSEVNVIFEMEPENTNNRPPSTPVAIYPEEGTIVGTTIQFAWDSTDPENDSLTFELEIRNSITENILTFPELTDSTYTVEGLEYDQKYFWQVKVSDGINEPVLSPIFSFETIPFPENRIFYVKTINGNSVIFSSDEAGNEYQLTSSDMNSFRPRKNNQIGKVAFLRTVGTQTHLFTMNFDGSQQDQVTTNIPINGFNLERIDFSWSNNGAYLIYPNFSKLYKIQANGGGNSLLYQTPDGTFITEVTVSEDNSMLALVTNNTVGYEASIYTINMAGTLLNTVLSGVSGAVGGIDISVDNQHLLYSHDISGFESPQYRQLNSHLFIYNFQTTASSDISDDKPNGTNDQDPRFSPNEAAVIFVNSSNDGISQPNIYKIELDNSTEDNARTLLFENTMMPDWE